MVIWGRGQSSTSWKTSCSSCERVWSTARRASHSVSVASVDVVDVGTQPHLGISTQSVVWKPPSNCVVAAPACWCGVGWGGWGVGGVLVGGGGVERSWMRHDEMGRMGPDET